ncbi:DUF2905 domain-containing protein [Gloeobacter violaceus]|nr:DUF2905 domain-containing protein [Gloeobacter violaceus]
MAEGLGLLLFLAGVVGTAFAGSLWPAARQHVPEPLGRLPGDVVYSGGGVTLYFPLMTSILFAVVGSAAVWSALRLVR